MVGGAGEGSHITAGTRTALSTHSKHHFLEQHCVIHRVKQSHQHHVSILLPTHLHHYTLHTLHNQLAILTGKKKEKVMCPLNTHSSKPNVSHSFKILSEITSTCSTCNMSFTHIITHMHAHTHLRCAVPDALQSHSGAVLCVEDSHHLLPQALNHLLHTHMHVRTHVRIHTRGGKSLKPIPTSSQHLTVRASVLQCRR